MVETPLDIGDRFDYEVPEVIWRPVFDESGEVTGYKVDPEFDWTWDHLTTLRHFAALIEHRTGQKMRVAPGEWGEVRDAEDPDLYEVLTGHATGGPATYEVVWSWMSGFETGVNELLWSVARQANKDQDESK